MTKTSTVAVWAKENIPMHKHTAFENPLVKYVLCICMYLFMYGNLRTFKIVSVRISNGFRVFLLSPLVTWSCAGFSSSFFPRCFFFAFQFSRQSVECVACFLLPRLLLLLLFCIFFFIVVIVDVIVVDSGWLPSWLVESFDPLSSHRPFSSISHPFHLQFAVFVVL